jgi:hypothetical protein
LSRVPTLPLVLSLLFVGGSAVAQTGPEPTCRSRIASFALQYAKPHHRMVFTFTGSQEALTPLWEATSGLNAESTLFPIDRTLFVVTIQIPVIEPNITAEALEAFAGVMCDIAAAHGARYNGAVALVANDMIGADMSEPPTK